MQDNMKSNLDKQFARFGLLVSLLCVLCVLCASVVNSAAQDFKTIHDGVEYAEVTRKLGDDPVRINLLRLDLTKVRLDVHHAMDAAIGTERTSSIATRHRAVAAINSGFFRLDTSVLAGDPAGVFMIDTELLSESTNNRTGIAMWPEKKVTGVTIGRFQTITSVGFEGGKDVVQISGINRERKDSEIIMYSPQFGRSTLSKSDGTEILYSKCKTIVRYEVIGTTCGTVEVNENKGDSIIPLNGRVLSIGRAAIQDREKIFSEIASFRLRESDRRRAFFRTVLRIGEQYFAPDKNTDIVAGVPQLIKNGKIDITWEQEKSSKAFVETRHPRTAVAKMKDGKFLMITVDGRQPGVSVGMNLNELAEYLLGLGAVDAMNLDGGGSTTMFLDGKVVNKPSDKEGERKVGDAILVTLRKKK